MSTGTYQNIVYNSLTAPVLSGLRTAVGYLLDQGVNKIVAIGSSGGINLVSFIIQNIYGIDAFGKDSLSSHYLLVKVLFMDGQCLAMPSNFIELETSWGSNIVVASGSFNGYDLGLLDIEFDMFGTVLNYSGQLTVLDQDVPDDIAMRQRPMIQEEANYY
jgi:hypothetical protein